ncbi:benzoate 4-monooxygenase cytochrome p450, partial [Colletotrichum incanum]
RAFAADFSPNQNPATTFFLNSHYQQKSLICSRSIMPFSTLFQTLPQSLPGWVLLLIAVIPCLTVIFKLKAISTSPLNQYPGPWLARYTNLWRLFVVRGGSYHLEIKKLHDEFGPVVRIGPNTLDLDFPGLKNTLYNRYDNWKKTPFYHNNSTLVNGQIVYHMFSTTDEKEHTKMRRPIGRYFTMTSVLAFEPQMNIVIQLFCDILSKRFAIPGTACKLDEWIGYYSWDLNGRALSSRGFDYMTQGLDHDNTMHLADKALDYFAQVGQMPWLDRLLDKNPIVRIGPPNLTTVATIAQERLQARLEGKDTNFNQGVPDFLQYFTECVEDKGAIINYIILVLLAGADTTAITIRAVFYYVLRHPEAHKKLVDEILSADLDIVPSYQDAKNLPYLNAVVREAMRMHPGVCMLLERYVPEGGLQLPGNKFVPAGTAVGINPYVVGRNKEVWGLDADVFRPERWLQGVNEDFSAFQERLRQYKAADLTFGAGKRDCIGKNLANLEIYKVVATMFRRFRFKLLDPVEDWEVTSSWFARQKGGLTCSITERRTEAKA